MCDKMHAKITLGVRWCMMCIFLFLKFDNFIKGIVHICIVFFKKLRLWFLYLTYNLVQMFIVLNTTDASFFN